MAASSGSPAAAGIACASASSDSTDSALVRCGPVSAHYLQVFPPGQTAAVYLPYQAKGCTKPVFVLGITAVVAGAGQAG